MKKVIFLCILLCLQLNVFSQTLVRKVVVDVENIPLEGAVITCLDDADQLLHGTITDRNGVFTISTNFDAEEWLRVSYLGYENQDICICGTNYFSLLSEDLISLIYKVSKRLTFFVLFEDYFTDFERIKSLSGSYYKIRLLTKRSSFSMENIGAIINNEKIQFDFIVENVDDCMYWDMIIEELNIQNYVIKPIANKNNTQFILDNVFLTQSEILQLKFNKREIFSHQVLNSNFFGHLIITPEGKVYSNFNKPELGTINDSIKFLLSKELKLKNSWLLIRDNVECSNCLYQWLCPSISNYELYLQTKCIKND